MLIKVLYDYTINLELLFQSNILNVVINYQHC